MNKIFKTSKYLFITMINLLMFSCNDDLCFNQMDFVGDSLVARWDIESSFPTSIVENYGVSGSGISYLESLSGKFHGKTVVIISGTNDMSLLSKKDHESISEYAIRYLAAINALEADKVYLYSIFPRGEQFNGETLNKLIVSTNTKVKEILKDHYSNIIYIDVYDQLSYKGFLNPQYSIDGLHLNVYGYALITNFLMSK